MKSLIRLTCFLLALVLLPHSLEAQRCDNQGTKVVCKTLPKSGNQTIDDCTIVKPDVCHKLSQYPQIDIHQGDFVGVQAWGCAQTGGHGLTWKDYVTPQYPKGAGAGLYFGQIWLKTDTATKADIFPIRRFAPHQESIGFNVPVGAHSEVWLGYVDDNYDDNGYWNPDSGNPTQCSGSDEAFVEIRIARSGLPAVPPFPSKPPPVVDTTISVNLPAIQAGEGPAVFGESWPPLPGTVGIIVKIRNPNSYSLDLLKLGRPSSACFSDPDSVVHLAPGQATTDMQTLFDKPRPPLPVGILTCIENAASIPPIVPIEVTYEHSPP